MHDEFRVRVDADPDDARALVRALRSLEVDEDRRRELGRLAVTHDGGEVYIYADSPGPAETARAAVEEQLAALGIPARVSLWRWHPLEDRWEDAATPLPTTEAERTAEHQRLEELEVQESREAGHAQWEVRITLPTHHDAREFAETLESEGIPVLRRWRHLIVGAVDEDHARELAERLRLEAPEGSELQVEGNPLEPWAMLHPFSIFGGLAQ